MVAYDYEVLQSKDLFTLEIKDAVQKLPEALSFTSELNDFIMLFLILNPKDRPKTRTLCTHPWLCGAFDSILNPPQMNPIILLSESSFANLSNRAWNSGPRSDLTTNSYMRLNAINNNNNSVNDINNNSKNNSNDNNNNNVNNNSNNNNNNNNNSSNINSNSFLYGLNSDLIRSQHLSHAAYPSPVPSSLSSSSTFINSSANHQFKSIVSSKGNQMCSDLPFHQIKFNSDNIDKINDLHVGSGNEINVYNICDKLTGNMNHNENDDSNNVNNENNNNDIINNGDDNNNSNNNNNNDSTSSCIHSGMKITLPSLHMQTPLLPIAGMTDLIDSPRGTILSGHLSSRERERDREREKEKEKAIEKCILEKTEKNEISKPVFLSKSHGNQLSSKGILELDSKERALLENYIRSRSGSFVGSTIPSKRNSLGDLIALGDLANWSRNIKSYNNNNNNNNSNSINHNNNHNNICTTKSYDENNINTTVANSLNNTYNNAINVSNLSINSGYSNSHKFVNFNNDGDDHDNNDRKSDIFDRQGSGCLERRGSGDSERRGSGCLERRGSGDSERRGSGATIGGEKFSVLTIGSNQENFSFIKSHLPPITDYNNRFHNINDNNDNNSNHDQNSNKNDNNDINRDSDNNNNDNDYANNNNINSNNSNNENNIDTNDRMTNIQPNLSTAFTDPGSYSTLSNTGPGFCSTLTNTGPGSSSTLSSTPAPNLSFCDRKDIKGGDKRISKGNDRSDKDNERNEIISIDASNDNDNNDDDDNDNDNDSDGNQNHSALSVQVENSVVDYDWSHLSAYLSNNNCNNNSNNNSNKNKSDSGLQDSDGEHSLNTSGKNSILRNESRRNNGNGCGVSFYGYGSPSYVAPRGSFVQNAESLGSSPKKQSTSERDLSNTLRGSMVDDEN